MSKITLVLALCTIARGQFPQAQLPAFRTPVPTPSTTPIVDAAGDVVLEVTPGTLTGLRYLVKGVPWVPGRDPSEQQADTHGRDDISKVKPQNDITVYGFLGIPYAHPPVDYRRFKPPQPRVKFEGDRYAATQFGNACPQNVELRPELKRREGYEFQTDEDCLFLNVWTPDIGRATQQRYPVLVFLHGGSFQYGSGNDWPGMVLASKGFVVVTVNYRLGPFGFATDGTKDSANLGLLDQRAALEWVKSNAFAFNGRPDAVALVGHGAGAVSAQLHMLSRGSQHLFRVVGALAGSSLAYEQVTTNTALMYNNTLRLARQVGCAVDHNTRGVMDCLNKRSPADILRAASEIRLDFKKYGFMPVAGNEVLPGAPSEMLSIRDVASPVPMITGTNQNDGSVYVLSDEINKINEFDVSYSTFRSEVARYVLRNNFTYNREAVIQAISHRYYYWPDIYNNKMMRRQLMEMATDALYVAPVARAARKFADAATRTFMYVNNYRMGTISDEDAKKPSQPVFPEWLEVFHESDAYLLFGFPWAPSELLPIHLRSTEWSVMDRNMSTFFMETFRQFALTENPNLARRTLWQPYDIRKHGYLDINVTTMMKYNYKWQSVAFWSSYLPDITLLWSTTLSPTVASVLWERRLLQGLSATFIVLAAVTTFLAGLFAYLYCSRRYLWTKLKEQRSYDL